VRPAQRGTLSYTNTRTRPPGSGIDRRRDRRQTAASRIAASPQRADHVCTVSCGQETRRTLPRLPHIIPAEQHCDRVRDAVRFATRGPLAPRDRRSSHGADKRFLWFAQALLAAGGAPQLSAGATVSKPRQTHRRCCESRAPSRGTSGALYTDFPHPTKGSRPIRPRAGATQRLARLIDDTGYGTWGTFGGQVAAQPDRVASMGRATRASTHCIVLADACGAPDRPQPSLCRLRRRHRNGHRVPATAGRFRPARP